MQKREEMPKDIIEEQSINERNIEILKQNFPNAIETDEGGKIIVNAQKLQMALDPSKVKVEEDGYELRWVGKKEAYHTAFTKNRKILKPLKDDSKEWDTTGNILIKGDNLDALRILKHSYFEQIKMIYIDPPYNTKSDEFVYNDDFTATQEETLEALGYSKESRDYVKNIYGAKTHSGWLSFMYPRLLLARDLLRDDGVIFISIDDNEQAQLKILCNEVFGENNFVANVIWEKKYSPQNDAKWFSANHDHILVYAKNKEIWRPNLLSRTNEQNERYKNPDNDSRGDWKSSDLSVKTYSSEYDYPITTPSGRIVQLPSGRCWMTNKEKMQELIKDNRIWFGENGGNVPSLKRFLSEVKDGITPLTIWFRKDVGDNQEAKQELLKVMPENLFDTPKSIRLIERMIQLSADEHSIILDFFAGSGTTAHAVMAQNAIIGCNYKFILVQIPEPINPKKQKETYDFIRNTLCKEPTIFEITAERIRRTGDKIVKGDLTTQNLDIGFRVFEVADDEKQAIYSKKLSEVTQSDLTELVNTPKSEEPETILYNLLTAEKLSLDTKIEELEKEVFYKAANAGIILGAFDIGRLRVILKEHGEIEYISVYSPLIEDDNFNLMLHSLLEQDEYKKYKLRIRG